MQEQAVDRGTQVLELARFVEKASYEDMTSAAAEALKIRVLDALGCAFGALDGDPPSMIREHLRDMGGNPLCTLIGGGKTSPDRAAFYNGALVRYLDFNDSFLAKGETCHPSDNLAPVLAAAEYRQAGGRDFLLALGLAYQVQCRLSEIAPVRHKGFDHTTQGAYAAAAGAAKALGLDREKTAHAVAISGTALNALRVTRTGRLSHWKGLAYPHTAFGAAHSAFLAMRGITGPLEVFEGNKGFMDAIAGPFTIDWGAQDLELVRSTIIKRYNAEVHSQSAIEGLLELKQAHGFSAADVERIEVEIFDVAFNIIGGGEEGDKKQIRRKEEADHSLPYILAVALLDGGVMPEQYHPERIVQADVQSLLRKVVIRESEALSRRFPGQMPCTIKVFLSNGTVYETQKSDYEGFHTRPMRWETVVRKFEALSERFVDRGVGEDIVAAVSNLDHLPVADLTALLAEAHRRPA